MVRKILSQFPWATEQQEQPFVQVTAHRSMWTEWQRLAASGTGWHTMLMSFKREPDKFARSSLGRSALDALNGTSDRDRLYWMSTRPRAARAWTAPKHQTEAELLHQRRCQSGQVQSGRGVAGNGSSPR